MTSFNFRVGLCRIRLSPRLNSKVKWTPLWTTLKLVFPTTVDPPGLQLLQSIRDVIDIDNLKCRIEEYSNTKDLAQAIQGGKCPVIVAQNQKKSLVHAMVAYRVTRNGNDQYVKCKNSYGQDPSQPGNFHNHFEIVKYRKNTWNHERYSRNSTWRYGQQWWMVYYLAHGSNLHKVYLIILSKPNNLIILYTNSSNDFYENIYLCSVKIF